MPNVVVLEQIELAELAQFVDDGRDAADLFKLPAWLRTLLNVRLADLKAKDAATLLTEGDRATASGRMRAALDQLTLLLRDGYNFIQGIPSFAISSPDRLGVFTAYGWESGLVGEFTDARVESLANQAIVATPAIPNAAHRYPTALLDFITAQLALVNANQPLATGGTAQAATAARDAALVLLQLATERVRSYYCCASDDKDQTPELAKIGRQPRRDPGQSGPPLPSEPGAATFDATALTLTIPALPDHATTIRAYRKPAGGVAELASTSPTNVVAVGPLTPGVTYEFWLVGHNTSGDGPESNHVTHVAT